MEFQFFNKESNNRCFGRKNSYEKQIRKTEDYFDIEECEVFQIVDN